MAIKHKVVINVTDENGDTKEVLQGGQLTLPQKIIKLLFRIEKFILRDHICQFFGH